MIKQTENKRYKQLDYQGGKILLDMDSNKITWLFPFLVWFLPIRGYKVDALPNFVPNQEKKGSGIIILVSSVCSNILIRMTNNGFGDLTVFSNYRTITITLLLCSVTTVFLIRYFGRHKRKEHKITNSTAVYVKFKFKWGLRGKLEYIYKIFLLTIICYMLNIFFVHLIVNVYSNIIVLPLILLLEYFLLIINTTILPPENDVEIIVLK